MGARAILRNDRVVKPVKRKGRVVGRDYEVKVSIETLADRSQYRGPDITTAESKAFFAWIDRKGMPTLRQMADRLGLDPGEDTALPVDDGKYHLRANPRKSYGYLYVVAWED